MWRLMCNPRGYHWFEYRSETQLLPHSDLNPTRHWVDRPWLTVRWSSWGPIVDLCCFLPVWTGSFFAATIFRNNSPFLTSTMALSYAFLLKIFPVVHNDSHCICTENKGNGNTSAFVFFSRRRISVQKITTHRSTDLTHNREKQCECTCQDSFSVRTKQCTDWPLLKS